MKIYLALAAAAVILGGVLAFTFHQRSIGGEAERAKQDKANAEFKIKASKGRVDYVTCDVGGGLYDFRKGTCELP
jgi:hypothetical protein